MRYFAMIWVLALFVVFVPIPSVEADPGSTELGHFESTELSYTLRAGGRTEVQMSFTLLNTSSTHRIDKTSWAVPSVKVSEVVINGAKLDGIEREEKSTTIKIKFLEWLEPSERVTYSISFFADDLIEESYPEYKGRFGQRGDPSYKVFGRLKHENYTVTIQGPEGTEFFSADPPCEVRENHPPKIEFTTELDAAEEFGGVEARFYSSPVYYKLTLTEKITNRHSEPSEDVRLDVILFGEMSSQFAALANPTPMAMYADRENNYHAVYDIGTIPPRENITLDIDVLFICDVHKPDITEFNTGKLSDAVGLTSYLQPDLYWEVDNQLIQQKAQKAVGDEKNAYLVAKAIVEKVNEEIEYPPEKKLKFYEERQGALKTLINGKGDCDCFSDLTIALSRAADLPARMSMGWAYENAKLGGHAWVEFYLPPHGWQPADPTWAEASGNYLGKLDPIHLLRSTRGLSSTRSDPPLTYFGADPEISEDASLTPMLEPAEVANELISSAELALEVSKGSSTWIAEARSYLNQARATENVDNKISIAKGVLRRTYSDFPRSRPERPTRIPPWLIWVSVAAVVAGVAAIVGGRIRSKKIKPEAPPPAQATSPAPAAPSPAPPAPARRFIICPMCNGAIPAESKVCPKCGATIE